MPRLIKRYENRKLYDTVAKRYISLEEIADLVRAGEEVVVVCAFWHAETPVGLGMMERQEIAEGPSSLVAEPQFENSKRG